MSIDTSIKTIGSSVLILAEDAIMAYLAVQAPWTTSPLINWLIKAVVGYVVGILINKTEFMVYVLAITDTVNSQNEDFKNAVKNNQTNPTPESQASLIAAARNLIKLTAP